MMNKGRKVASMSGQALLLLFGFFMAFSACDLSSEQAKVESILNDTLLSERAENVEMKFSDSGQLKALLFANVLERIPAEEPYTLFEQGISGYFYGPEGKVENSVKSKYAIRYDEKKQVVLKQNVELINTKKEKLNTEKLTWDQNTGKIYTDAFVKITTPDNIIFGEGFEADQNFTEYKIFKVKGEISVDEKDQ